MAVTVRLFAAAREAAGTSTLEVPPGPLALPDLGQRFAQVLAMSTVLHEGRHISSGDDLPDGAVVDVLPPFAGG